MLFCEGRGITTGHPFSIQGFFSSGCKWDGLWMNFHPGNWIAMEIKVKICRKCEPSIFECGYILAISSTEV